MVQSNAVPATALHLARYCTPIEKENSSFMVQNQEKATMLSGSAEQAQFSLLK